MAEFQLVTKEIERMCDYYESECRTDNCPLYAKDLCYAKALSMIDSDNCDKLAKVVMKWAEEHPKPMYPTWAEYLKSIGVITSDNPFPAPNIMVCLFQVERKMFEHIDAETGQKLGLEPKEN